jgi:hypothetical protein
LYDTLPGGAGFARAATLKGVGLFEEALRLMEHCPDAGCDSSCYRCLRTFRNRMDHSALDRHVGAALLRVILGHKGVGFDRRRLRLAAKVLGDDLRRQIDSGWAVNVVSGALLDDGEVHEGLEVVDGVGVKHVLVVRSPIVNLDYDTASTVDSKWGSATTISELTIRKNLPDATRQALSALTKQA